MSANHPLPQSITGLIDSIRLGEPHLHGKFGLWPVFATPRPLPPYLTLVEALALDDFKITEISTDGSVPDLRVVNKTDHNVLLFDGEELKGAKQNRILNASILVPAASTLTVPVSCTESGRWTFDTPDFESSGTFAYGNLRKKKAAAVAESLARHKGAASNQSEVWEEIEKLHVAADTDRESDTRAMRHAYEKRRKELDEFTRNITCRENQCGLLAVVGDRVEGCDIVSRPEAYAKLHHRLVDSHAMDFLIRKRAKASAKLDPEAPARFLNEAMKAEQSKHNSPGMGADHRLKFRWGFGSALVVDETVVHLALFGGSGPGKGSHHHQPRLIRYRP